MNIGVMQGRLLPKIKGKFQAFPDKIWEKEFKIASKLNLDSIEFIFDGENINHNPLSSENGIKHIKEIEVSSGVKVKSVCADYFMYNSFFEVSDDSYNARKETLENLISNCANTNIKNIVLPCVDQASLNKYPLRKKILAKLINQIHPTLLKNNIFLALETDLKPKSYKDLLQFINCKNLKVNYDVGNSASLGYDIEDEFDNYKNFICDIHIKDRKFNGNSVILGSGSVNFEKFIKCFSKINKNNYVLIMQAFRDEEGLDLFTKQLNWFKDKINKYNK